MSQLRLILPGIRRTIRTRLRSANPERGSTLIEVLIALSLIGIAAPALLGGLATTITASGEHRSFAVLDTLLKSFAETAKFQIQQQMNPEFTNCATSYLLASAPTPSSGPAGTAVTVFATGFSGGGQFSVVLGTTTVLSMQPVPASGNVSATFDVPLTGFIAGSTYPVTVSDGTNSATSTTSFAVTSGTPILTSALAGYSLGISSVATWSNSAGAFTSDALPNSCTASGTQLVTLSAASPGNVSDTLSIVAINPAFVVRAFTPTVTISAAPTGATSFQSLTFTATVAGPTNSPAPTGTVSWAFTSYPGGTAPNCATSTLTGGGANESTATCSVASVLAGTYSLTALYEGDGNYVAVSGPGSATVQGFTPTVTISSAPAGATTGSSVTFTATVAGPTSSPAPTGTVSWAFTSYPGGTAPNCATSTLTGGGANESTASCSVASVLAGTYSLTASYGGDSYYLSTVGSASIDTGASAPAISVGVAPSSPTPGSTITFTATVAGPVGGPAPTGSLSTWGLSGPGSPGCSALSLVPGGGNSSSATCQVSGAMVGTYTVAPNYAGDANYGATTGSGSVVVSDPPMVVAGIATANASGGTAGMLGVGDSFSVTFSNAVDPATINQAAGTQTITLCDRQNKCSANKSTSIIISGLSVPAGFVVGDTYESSSDTSTASGTLSLSNANKTVTFTVTHILTNGGDIGQGGAVTFTFTPYSSIKDTNGTAASGSWTTPTALKLF